MSYEDYKRNWKVLPLVGLFAQCKPNEIVTFEGPEGKVVIRCAGTSHYGEGEYDPLSDAIRGRHGEYEISMVEDAVPRRIAFNLTGGIAGSWTAEDQSPWPGPEDR